MAELKSKPGTNSLSSRDTDSWETKNPFSFLPKLALQIPFFNQLKKPISSSSETKEEPALIEVSGGEMTNQEIPKPNVVSFPNTRPVVPPLETEVQESSGKTHNPVVFWQVYAIGGFIILKWVWARWQERRERAKKASTDDQQSPEDESHSAGDEA